MRMRKLIATVLSAMLVLLSLTACQSQNSGKNESSSQTESETSADIETTAESTSPVEISDLYNFEKYESSDVFNISKVKLNEKLENTCVSYQFTYYSDGLRIRGYISIPYSLATTQKPGKCVMYNHGGNRGYGKLEDHTTAVVCALCDRIVVGSQYRGGGGSEGKDEFGGDDLNDVIKLIDLCEKQFSFVDMDDFCVIGASRGGVMTYPAARQDKRIKRIIASSAVSDLFESYESRDDMKSVLEETIGCTPQEKPEEYKKRSAIYWADEIKIPVLIFHSKNDPQVSYKQAEELYAKLKDTTDCTLITYDDDLHCNIREEDYPKIKKFLNSK